MRGSNFSYSLEKVGKGERFEYVLNLENKKKEKGEYNDSLILKTDSKACPEIRIKVSGLIFGKGEEDRFNEFEQRLQMFKTMLK